MTKINNIRVGETPFDDNDVLYCEVCEEDITEEQDEKYGGFCSEHCLWLFQL